MRPLLTVLGFAVAMGLAGCDGPATAPEVPCACCAKDPAKPMTGDKKDPAGGCCSKEGAKAPAGEGHQH